MGSANIFENRPNPFPGLRPFSHEESDYFFGRSSESEILVTKLLTNHFVAVTGASGSGKSSLVSCGVIPGIKQLRAQPEEKWQVLSMHPGTDPLGNLVNCLLGDKADPEERDQQRADMITALSHGNDGLSKIISNYISGSGGKLLLFIDQFEEVIRYSKTNSGQICAETASGFLNLLIKAVLNNNPGFYLIITLQSDLISEFSFCRRFLELVNSSNYLVSGLDAEKLKEAIVNPIRNAGAEIDNELVELLINEVIDRPDQLPVLQHSLMRTWTHWSELNEHERAIGLKDYCTTGTMKDAISRHADEIYGRLGKEQRRICERLFRIITWKSWDNRGIRYPSDVKTIRLAAECDYHELLVVIEKFRAPGVSILAPLHTVPLDDDSIIDLTHECLINLWSRLAAWVEEENESVQIYMRLSETSSLYHQGKIGLLKQPDLQVAINWRLNNNPNLFWAKKYNPAFERAMVYLRTSEKEYLESEESKLRINRWRIRRIRIMSSIFGVVALFTVIALIAAVISKKSAENRLNFTDNKNLELEKQKAASDHYAAIALKQSVRSDSSALEASRKSQMEKMLRMNAENRIIVKEEEAKEARRQSEQASVASLASKLIADSVIRVKDETQRQRMITLAKSLSLRSLDLQGQSDLQALLAMQGYLFNKKNGGNRNDADIYTALYSIAKQKASLKLKRITGFPDPVRRIASIPGKKEFFTSDARGRILRWNLENNEQTFKIFYSEDYPVEALAVSPDSRWLACGGVTSVIKMISIAGNETGYDLKGHDGKINSLIFSGDGKFLYSAGIDGKVLKWDLASGTSLNLSTEMLGITSIDLSSDNRYIAGISNKGLAYVWNPDLNSEKICIGTPGKQIRVIRFKPEEELLAMGYDDGSVELWDVSAARKITGFSAHSKPVNYIQFNRNLSQMATASEDETLKLWNNDDLTSLPVCFNDNDGIVIALDFSSDGEIFLTGISGSQAILVARPASADSFGTDGCLYISRNFTQEEWMAYVGKGIPFEKTCAESDYRIRIREVR